MRKLHYMAIVLSFIALSIIITSCSGCKVKDVREEKTAFTESREAENKKSEQQLPETEISVSGSEHQQGDHIKFSGVDNPMQYPSVITFVGGKAVDLREIDPYRNLEYRKAWDDYGGLDRCYDLSSLSRNQQDELLSGCRINEEAFRESNYLRMVNKLPVVVTEQDKVAIAYHEAYYTNAEDIYATEGYVLIYDTRGHLLHKIHDKKDGFYDILLSSDGKYLMQKYGTNYGEDGGGQLENGFKFYDTDTGEKVFEWEMGRDRFLDGYNYLLSPTNTFIVERGFKKSHELILFSLLDKSVYRLTTDMQFNKRDQDFFYRKLKRFTESKDFNDLLTNGFIKIDK